MMQSFEEFCGNSPIWDLDLLMQSSYPKFTECFQTTLLVWIPCGVLWILLPFYMYFLYNSKDAALPLTWLNIWKSLVSVLLFVLSGADIVYGADNKRVGSMHYSTAFFLSGSIKAATFLLTALLVQFERLKGVLTSGVLFVFWFLTTLAGIVPFYTLIIEKAYKEEIFHFSLFYIYYGLVLIQLVLSSFAETQHRRGYQAPSKPQCPEVTASFPSKLSFWWITSVIVNAFRLGIDEDHFWELNPRDQSGTILPGFHAAWQGELDKYRHLRAKRKHPEYNEASSCTYQSKSQRAAILSPNTSPKRYDSIEFKDGHTDRKAGSSKGGPSLLKVIVKVFGKHIALGWLCKLVYDFLQFVNPMILNLLIGYVQNKNAGDESEPIWKGYVFGVGMFVVAATQSVFIHQNFHLGMTAGMRIKSALTSAVYNKALTMNSEAKKTKTQGEIVNLMSVDCQRIQDIIGNLWVLWSAPLQVTLAMILLWQTLGVSVLAGLAILILLMPANALIAMKQRRYQVEQMRYKDQRLKLMSEVLNGIKVLKLYAWEPSFEQRVQEVRARELAVLRKSAYLNCIGIFFFTSAPFLVTLATFATYILIDDNNQLDAQKAFVSLSLFNILRIPLDQLPNIISYVVQGTVALGRINKFLQADDIDPDSVEYSENAGSSLSITNGTFGWNYESEPNLKDINLDVGDGKLVAVVGQVGAGKSSLVSAFLGEMEKYEGKVKVKGSVAYVPQQAWIQNNTVKANILFGAEYDQSKYRNVIDACALQPDLDILQGGDMTEIGEKGINLSGGQKQRVSLARAVYHNADVYLLDDPLSAVDSHVGKHIFNKVIGANGLLKNKTRILVTNGVHWLPMVDQIVVMVNGKISELGSYEELLSHDGVFAQFLKTYLKQEEEEEGQQLIRQQSEEEVEPVSPGSDSTEASSGAESPTTGLKSRKKGKQPLSRSGSSISSEKGKLLDDIEPKLTDKLIQKERAEIGKVSWHVYMSYFYAVGSLATAVIFSLYLLYQGAGIVDSIWLATWTDDPYLGNISNANTPDFRDRNYMYLGVYAAIGLGQGCIIFVYALMAANRMVRAAGLLHKGMLANVLRLPMAFFDTTPLGRLVNRFSRDVETVDNNLPLNFRAFLNTFFSALSTFVVIGYSTPLFLVIVIPMAVVYYLVQRFYIPASRQVKRIESTTRSPIYSHFAESIAGASTIRSYRAQQRFMEESQHKVDKNLVFYFVGIVSNRWLGWRLEILGNIIVFSAAIFAVVTPGNTGGLVGLSISYALQVTSALNCLVRNTSNVETNIVAVERMAEYTHQPTEAEWRLPFRRPVIGWPDKGNVRFNNYSARYRDGLDLVLRDISCNITGGERVGIVGRTGAGKSSLTVALFRIIEAAGGNIVIDGERISDMGLHDLRSKLTILPQDPVLFSGTLRMNVDPFESFTDAQIWRTLERAHLKAFVSGLPEGLDHECGEGGHNLRIVADTLIYGTPYANRVDSDETAPTGAVSSGSTLFANTSNHVTMSVGQRQLVCLARTLLRKTKILILDEATAAVDMETDDLIQKTIREEFKGCTILTIAHRLNTIMDYDRVVVLDQGVIKEFDRPQQLLEDSSTIFHSMARDANLI